MGFLETFQQRKFVRETVFLDSGERQVCLAIQDFDGSLKLGLLPPELFAQIEWVPHEVRLQEIAGSADFLPVVKVEMPRREYFAVSSLAFTLADSRVVTGKTDREFAEWLMTVLQAG
jgi:hypothetical protein